MLLADASIVIVGVPYNTDSPDTFAIYDDDGAMLTALIDPLGAVVIGVS